MQAVIDDPEGEQRLLDRHRAHRRLGGSVCRAARSDYRAWERIEVVGRETDRGEPESRGAAHEDCHYNEGLVGAAVGEKPFPIGDALMKAGHLKPVTACSK
jgi:hypothetical protein